MSSELTDWQRLDATIPGRCAWHDNGVHRWVIGPNGWRCLCQAMANAGRKAVR